MKVAFLIHSLEVNSCRYRVLQYLPYLKKHGLDVTLHFYQRTWVDKLKFYNTLGDHDILYIHRKLFSPLEFWYIRNKANKIIYDFDDALMYRSSGSGNPHSFSRRLKFAYMMKRIDFVIAGNQFLKSETLRYNPHVEVIPTSIDLSRYNLKERFHRDGPITIGWLGSSSTLKYLQDLSPVFEDLFKIFPNTRLKIVCDDFFDLPNMPVIKKRWSLEEEVEDLKSFDIGVMPLTHDLWSQGKCGLKILQYYSVGLAVVCSPVGVNKDIVKDRENGFWAQNQDEWKYGLAELIKNEASRRTLGDKGRTTVEGSYSLEVNAPRLLDILRKAVEKEEKRN
ncbi:MAG: glycosyltransferase family 4 protein [Deltaproteobacteria bacterium]|nr:glycosyltransferase family 4 protein [Deltaproteobacteria bacterium]MBM4325169.1 glycosyltransferase family 4 protein [Deltaproteobacteria bacterium]MBM4347838.1 glycosyltransferase family 4 protein [Deltaproteobacteria bacterium]